METEIKFSTEMITPMRAQDYLDKNNGNRRLSEQNILFLTKEMRSGNWRDTGDTLKLSKTGVLLDGQHRLAALIKSGKTLRFTVARGLDDEIFQVLDTGKKRSASDSLSIKGYKNVNDLAGIVRHIIGYQKGTYIGTRASKYTVSNSEVTEFVDKNPGIHDVVDYAVTVYRRFKFIPSSGIGMLYFVLSKKNQEKADIFFEKYATGIDLSEKSPIRVLRERLLRDLANKKRLTVRDKTALFITAWNYYLKNQYVANFSLRDNADFPKPI